MASLSTADDGVKSDGLIARLVDRVFGYDFFISYSHGDGMRLPRRIKERLEQAGFRVFLDQTEYVAGADLRRETRRQVLKSRKIVVIGRAGALKSEWVKREVEVALAGGKIPVILNVNGAVEAAPRDAALATMARERHWLRLTETFDDPDGEPTDRIISELVRGFNHTRQETKRQRILATAAAVLAIAAGIATWQAVEAIRARNVAEAERDRAERVLAQVIGTANRRVQAISLRIRKERAAAQAAKPISAPAADATEAGTKSPLEQANDLIGKATVLLRRGDFHGAHPPLAAALRILGSGGETESAESQWHLALFRVYGRLAEAAVGGGDPEAGLAALMKGLEVAQGRTTGEPTALDWRQRQAALHQKIGDLQLDQARTAEAEKHYREATVLWRELASTPSTLLPAQRELAFSLAQLGDLELSRNNAEAAIAFFKEGVSLLERLATSSGSNPERQRDLSIGYQQITDTLLKAKRPEEALIWADKDLAISHSLAGNAGPSEQRDLASSYDRRARALDMLGRNAEALDSYDKGAALFDAAIAADDAQSSWQRDAAAMLESMGRLLGKKMGQHERAIHSYRQALTIREGLAASREGPSWQREIEEAYRRASEFMREIGRDQDAIETAEQYLLATSLTVNIDNSRVERIGRALGTLCWSALNAGKDPRAMWACQHAIDLAPKLDWIRRNYAHALMLSGERGKAKEIYLAGASLPPAEAKTWKADVLKDFDQLKQRRGVDALMVEISTRWGTSD